eukprot:UN00469
MFRQPIASSYMQKYMTQYSRRYFTANAVNNVTTTNAASVVKKTSTTKTMLTDPGNYPIIAANLWAATMLVVVSFRRLTFHPDVAVSDELRSSIEVQNEVPKRLEQATTFRSQTEAFANFLVEPTRKVMELFTGTPLSTKYELQFIRHQPIDTPLEQTNYFDDGLYSQTHATDYAMNEDNGKW